jgi:hypothetical protein
MTRPVLWRWADGRFCERDSSRESVTCLRADVNREQHEYCVDHERRDESGNGDVNGIDWGVQWEVGVTYEDGGAALWGSASLWCY